MKPKLLLTAAALLLGIQSFAGVGDTSVNNIYKGPLMQRPIMAGIHIGTQGIGAFVRYRPVEMLYVRLGFSTIPVNIDRNLDLNSLKSQFAFNNNFSNIHLWGELKPSHWSSFRIVGGVGYFFKAKSEISIQPTGTYKYGEINVPGDQIGKLNASVDWSGIAPYLGAGFFRSMPRKRIGLNLDYGWYMLPKPKVKLHATNMLAANESNEAQIQDNLKGYRWLPALQLNIIYKFN